MGQSNSRKAILVHILVYPEIILESNATAAVASNSTSAAPAADNILYHIFSSYDRKNKQALQFKQAKKLIRHVFQSLHYCMKIIIRQMKKRQFDRTEIGVYAYEAKMFRKKTLYVPFLQTAFDMIDKDHTGSINYAQFRRWFVKFLKNSANVLKDTHGLLKDHFQATQSKMEAYIKEIEQGKSALPTHDPADAKRKRKRRQAARKKKKRSKSKQQLDADQVDTNTSSSDSSSDPGENVSEEMEGTDDDSLYAPSGEDLGQILMRDATDDEASVASNNGVTWEEVDDGISTPARNDFTKKPELVDPVSNNSRMHGEADSAAREQNDASSLAAAAAESSIAGSDVIQQLQDTLQEKERLISQLQESLEHHKEENEQLRRRLQQYEENQGDTASILS